MEGQSIFFEFGLLLILTLINAFFAAAEMAMVQVNHTRLEQQAEQGNKKAKLILKVLQDPTNFLSTIQVGITVVTLLSGASLADSLAQMMTHLLGGSTIAYQISKVIAMVILTYISIVFGELYPKRIAMNCPDQVARFVVQPIRALSVLAKPFVWLLSASIDVLAKMTPMKIDDATNKMTRDEMRYMLENEGANVLDNEELEMVQGVFALDSIKAKEVMVPRPDMFMIDANAPLLENIQAILNERFSRIPVYREDKDRILGIVHTKRILNAAYHKGFEQLALEDILQEPLFVPETIFADDLLYEFKRTQNQMAIVLDEYGSTVGLVTLEDLLEEIVGEIDDESDEVDYLYKKIDDTHYIIQGKMTINEFNDMFDTKLAMDEVDTMAGYLISALGVIPEEDEHLSYEVDHIRLTSIAVEDARITQIGVDFLQNLADEENSKQG